MPEGYIKTRADATWWMDQISAGEAYRKKYALEAQWAKWRKYYRGRWKAGTLPANVFFSMLRSTVPRIYFRNPAVSVTPALPGFLHMAFAQVLNRIDNKLIRTMGLKHEMKDIVQDAWLKGTGVGKIGIGSQFPTETEDEAPFGSRGERFEYQTNVQPNRPWFMRTDTGHFVVADGLRRMREARWCAELIQRPKDDLIRDPRIKAGADTLRAAQVKTPSGDTVMRPIEMVDVYEIRDRKYDQLILMAPHSDREGQILYQGNDPLSERSLPFRDVVFNPDDEVFWGVPDAQILEPYQLEINEIRTQNMKHRRLALIKIIADMNSISEDEIAKMFTEEVGAVVKVDGQPANAVAHFQVANIPTDLQIASQEVRQDIRESLGFGRNQMGDFQTRRGDTSATEAAIVQAGSELRIDEKRDTISDLLVSVIEEMHEIIFDRWSAEQVVEVVGPGGMPTWVQVNPGILKEGRYVVKVDPDSAAVRTREQREAKAMALYQVLKENPMIDPMKLTQYLINEMEGVELDDFMRALPPQQGGGQGGPLSMGQFASQIGQGVRTAGAGGARRLAAGGG